MTIEINGTLYKDLSKMTIDGTEVDTRETANCYVISSPGNYCFPLVYGNAIKNDSVNREAYTNLGGTYQADFVNYSNHRITSPYIELDTEELVTIIDFLISDTDISSNFSRPSIASVSGESCRFVYFSISSIPETGANIILGAENIEGTVLWSWHIWLWDEDLTPVTIENHEEQEYDILPVNLGSKYVGGELKNWFYQWGRKDPVVFSSNNYGTYNFFTSPATNVGSAIQNPCTFFGRDFENVNSSWINNLTYYYNFWNSTYGSSTEEIMHKTIYDPCPRGFVVPNARVFTGFTSTGENTIYIEERPGAWTNGGLEFEITRVITVFYPASGYREESTGTLTDAGTLGYYWTTGSVTGPLASLLEFGEDRILPSAEINKSSACSIRPIVETVDDEPGEDPGGGGDEPGGGGGGGDDPITPDPDDPITPIPEEEIINNKHLIHLHSTTTADPSSSKLEVGELAVNNNKSELFVKNTEGTITRFSRIGTKEKVENKVTSINLFSTHTQYPSAKCFYSWMLDIFNNSSGGVNNYTTVGYYVDLSRCDINLKPQPLRETANSYIISQPGFYCFPLVYGCGIKERNIPGDTDLNPKSYIPFNISSPYITGISSASIIESDETNPTLENLTLLDGGYLGFHVSSIPSSGANYKLGVLNSSNEVLWSWHIWLWPEPLNLERVYNSYDNEYEILPVNLGSKYVGGELKNWFYQWGRKDPITFDNPSVVSETGNDCTKFYTSWEPRINYWDANKTSATSGESLIEKTIYDPCPRGFVVPNAKVFTGFTTIGEWNGGWNVKKYSTDTEGIFFSASDYLNSSGVLVQEEGKYWTSGLLNEGNAYILSLTEDNLNNNGTIQFNYGLSIRPVLQK